jgi:hypothetical protein
LAFFSLRASVKGVRGGDCMRSFAGLGFIAGFVLVCLHLLLPSRVGAEAPMLLVPMDETQTAHCRAYGLTYQALQRGAPNVAWLLNFRGGSFLVPDQPEIRQFATGAGIRIEPVTTTEVQQIFAVIAEENMDVVALETAPRIGIYLPEGDDSDVVASLLTYSGIAWTRVYDAEILGNGLEKIDWLHIHHRDFTGQGHKRGPDAGDRETARRHGFSAVWQMKHEVAERIRAFLFNGGFLFAMCSAAETFDIALAAQGIDIVGRWFDNTDTDENFQARLDFERSLAFTDFTITPEIPRGYSDIDVTINRRDSTFRLFPFAAQVDAIPALLNQNHTQTIQGFMGETSSFRKALVKKSVTILAENNDGVSVRYLCGTHGRGVFSYYGGHAPGHGAGAYVREAPGFRLILNNVLFPAAKIKPRKT